MQTPQPRPRRRRRSDAGELLGVEAIVDAALGLVAESRLDAVTIRDVAAALNTGPSSLYSWVPNTMTLHHLMLSRALEHVRLPSPDPEHWQEQLTALATRVYDHLARYPGLGSVMLGFIPLDRSSLRIADRYLALMRVGGVSDDDAVFAVDTITLYVAAASYERHIRPEDMGPYTDEAATVHRLDRSGTNRAIDAVDPKLMPDLSRLAHRISRGTQRARFLFGLRSIVAGIAHRPDD